MSDEKWFAHAGDLGDLIYSLPAIRAAGGGKLYLYHTGGCREPMTQRRFDVIAPLLRRQSYITDVEFSPNHKGHALNGFRDHLHGHGPRTLADAHLAALGLPLEERGTSWLTVDAAKPPLPVLFHRSSRYQNPLFPWQRIYDKYKGMCMFVGMPDEHRAFEQKYGTLPYLPTANLLELAQYMAGAKLFVGNQSCPLAIAHGLDVPTIMELCPTPAMDNCQISRMNCIVGRDPWFKLPDVCPALEVVPAKPKPVLAIYGYGTHYEGMIFDHRERHQFYCDRHGFKLVECTAPIVASDHPYWNKIHFIRELLDTDAPYVAYIDCDCFVQDMHRNLTEALPDWAWLGLTVHPFPNEWTTFHFNCGAMYIRNCPESKAFFSKVLEGRDKYPDPKHWGEQTVINHLLLDDPNNQSGLVVLDHRWNANVHNMPHSDAIVAAWHGASEAGKRRVDMQKYGFSLPPYWDHSV